MQNRKLATLFLAAVVAFSSLSTGTAAYAMEAGEITEETALEDEETAVLDRIIGDYASDNSSEDPGPVIEPSGTIDVRNIILDKSEVRMYPGDTVVITARVTPENAANKKLIWSVPDVDTVSWKQISGLDGDSLVSAIEITALNPGGVEVCVSSEANPDCRNSCWIIVENPDDSWEWGEPIEKDGLKVYGTYDFTYIGINQTYKSGQIKVYSAGRKLVENTDYTLSYKNNLNAGTATMTVNLKGDYSGSVDIPFTINKYNLSECRYIDYDTQELVTSYGQNFNTDKMAALENGSLQKMSPNIYIKFSSNNGNGKSRKLVLTSKDFDCTYPSEDEGDRKAYKDPGYWDVQITGKGNFTGTYTLHEQIYPKENSKPLSKVTVKSAKNLINSRMYTKY